MRKEPFISLIMILTSWQVISRVVLSSRIWCFNCFYWWKLYEIKIKFQKRQCQKNDSNTQEFMVTLSISNASHRSFNGQTRGIDFFTLLIKNLMVFVPKYPGLYDLLKSTPPSLSNFLERVSVPYLVPNLTPELQSDLQGIVRIGECRRCSDNEGVDVAFTIFIDNVEVVTSYVECKYVDNTSNNNHDHKHYIAEVSHLKEIPKFQFFYIYNVNVFSIFFNDVHLCR